MENWDHMMWVPWKPLAVSVRETTRVTVYGKARCEKQPGGAVAVMVTDLRRVWAENLSDMLQRRFETSNPHAVFDEARVRAFVEQCFADEDGAAARAWTLAPHGDHAVLTLTTTQTPPTRLEFRLAAPPAERDLLHRHVTLPMLAHARLLAARAARLEADVAKLDTDRARLVRELREHSLAPAHRLARLAPATDAVDGPALLVAVEHAGERSVYVRDATATNPVGGCPDDAAAVLSAVAAVCGAPRAGPARKRERSPEPLGRRSPEARAAPGVSAAVALAQTTVATRRRPQEPPAFLRL